MFIFVDCNQIFMSLPSKKVIISGSHPLLEDVTRSYSELGYEIVTDTADESVCADEIFIATRKGGESPLSADMQNIAMLKSICGRAAQQEVRPKAHILLHSREAMKMMQTWDQDDESMHDVELIPFTMESHWAVRLLVSYPGSPAGYRPLDYKPMTSDSKRTVHLLLFGINDMSMEIARHAALVCHFPNYTRDHTLKTRITFIDPEADTLKDRFINANQTLFNNSFYRTIDLSAKKVTEFHQPAYHETREEFVDIEWEFVKGNADSPVLREKMKAWAGSDRQILSLAVCGEDDNENISTAMQLPEEIYDMDVPVMVRVHDDTLFKGMKSRKQSSMTAFGMDRCSYDITQPLISMAKMINYVYNEMWPVSIDMDKAEKMWKGLSNAKKWSNIYHAMTISPKMRALGHQDDDWDTFYCISANEMELLAEVEHNRWSVEELLLGFRPVTDGEQEILEKDITRKREFRDRFIHYDLRAYDDLRPDADGTDVKIYDRCISAAIPMIAGTFRKKEGHE